MIYNTNQIFATVWKVTPSENGKYIDLKITTSEKNSNGDYENSHWYPRAIGKAVNTLKNVKREDHIVITKSKYTNVLRGTDEAKKPFFRFLILEAEIETEKKGSGNTPPSEAKKVEEPPKEAPTPAATVAEDTCPW